MLTHINCSDNTDKTVQDQKVLLNYTSALRFKNMLPRTHRGIQTWLPNTTAPSPMDSIMLIVTESLTTYACFSLHQVLFKDSQCIYTFIGYLLGAPVLTLPSFLFYLFIFGFLYFLLLPGVLLITRLLPVFDPNSCSCLGSVCIASAWLS